MQPPCHLPCLAGHHSCCLLPAAAATAAHLAGCRAGRACCWTAERARWVRCAAPTAPRQRCGRWPAWAACGCRTGMQVGGGKGRVVGSGGGAQRVMQQRVLCRRGSESCWLVAMPPDVCLAYSPACRLLLAALRPPPPQPPAPHCPPQTTCLVCCRCWLPTQQTCRHCWWWALARCATGWQRRRQLRASAAATASFIAQSSTSRVRVWGRLCLDSLSLVAGPACSICSDGSEAQLAGQAPLLPGELLCLYHCLHLCDRPLPCCCPAGHWARQALQHKLGITHINCVPVQHCSGDCQLLPLCRCPGDLQIMYKSCTVASFNFPSDACPCLPLPAPCRCVRLSAGP